MHLRIWLAPEVIYIFAPKLISVLTEENERIIVVIESAAVYPSWTDDEISMGTQIEGEV